MFEIIPFDRHIRHLAAMDPFREFDELERSFFGNNSSMVSAFRTDVIDTGDAYKLEAELPGFNKEDIQLNVENDCLTVTAEHKSEKKEEDEKKNFIKRERFYGSYTRREGRRDPRQPQAGDQVRDHPVIPLFNIPHIQKPPGGNSRLAACLVAHSRGSV